MDIHTNQFGGIFPRFYMKAVEDKPASREAGRPIFQDREWIEIRIAGDSKTVVRSKVKDEHKARWPEHYRRFREGMEAPVIGTRLEQWPQLTGARVAELKALNIHTVEDLAALKDASIQNIGMGGRQLVAQAQAFIDAAQGGAETAKLAAENQKLQDRVTMLEEQIKALGSEPKKRRGRPRKAAVAEETTED